MQAIEQHITIQELAARLGVHRDTVRRAIDEGTRSRGARGLYPVRRFGRRVAIPETAAASWVESQTVRTI